MTQSFHLVIDYTTMGTILELKLTSQDNHQAQTPRDFLSGLIAYYSSGMVIMPKATALYDYKPERKGHARLHAQHRSFIIISFINFAQQAPTFLFLMGRTWKSNMCFLCILPM